MTEIGDALTSVRKRDWSRLVRSAAHGDSIILTDPDLPQPILLVTLHGADEHIAAITHNGSTRGAWATGRAAAWLRGRAWTALVTALMPLDDAEDTVTDNVAWTLGLILPLDVPLIDTDDLSASEGRRILRALAGTAPDDEHAVMVRVPGEPAEVVMLASRGVWRATSPVALHEDGPDSRVVRTGLWLHDVGRVISDVGHEAWVAEQAGRPWGPEQAADRFLAAADAVGLPVARLA